MDETRAIFAAFIGKCFSVDSQIQATQHLYIRRKCCPTGGCGGLFLLLVVWKLRRKLSCCLSGRKEPSQAEVLRFAAQLYTKELADSEPTRCVLWQRFPIFIAAV